MNWVVEFIRLLPELVRLVKTLSDEKKMTPEKDIKKDIQTIRKAIEEKDDKALSDVFKSLND